MDKQKVYTKQETLKILSKSATIFHKNLENRNLFIIAKFQHNLKGYKIGFTGNNFMHFTGIESNLSPATFYHNALNGKLQYNDFDYKDDILTSMKISVLEQAMELPTTAKLIGDYIGPHIKLKADIGAGNVSYVMTCRYEETEHAVLYPVGLQKEDGRDTTTKSPIVAIFRKNHNEKTYSEMTYKSKNINIDKLHFPKEIRALISDSAFHKLKPQQGQSPAGVLDGTKQTEQAEESSPVNRRKKRTR